jgi:hypothetical protein
MQDTNTRQIDPTITALWCGSWLFEVVVNELAARGLDDPASIRRGVVWQALAQSYSLSHGVWDRNLSELQVNGADKVSRDT